MHTDILIGLLSRIVPLRRSMYEKDKVGQTCRRERWTRSWLCDRKMAWTRQIAPHPSSWSSCQPRCGWKVPATTKDGSVTSSTVCRPLDFTANERLFPKLTLPVINIEARQYPVTLHFSKRTLVDKDPVAAVIKKVRVIRAACCSSSYASVRGRFERSLCLSCLQV